MSALDVAEVIAVTPMFCSDALFGKRSTKRMASFRIFVESMINDGRIEKTPNMTEKLAIIDKHLNENAKSWQKSAQHAGETSTKTRMAPL